MKKSKIITLWVLTFITGMVVGAACMRWSAREVRVKYAACQASKLDALRLAQWEEASLPEGTQEVQTDNTPQSSADLPSQLVRSNLPQDMVGVGHVTAQPTDETPGGVVLSDAQNTVVLNARLPAQRAADDSKITLIEAPVSVKRIADLSAYKTFKQTARGSYPVADFAKEEVIVLESASNLPDNVFEIVDITPQADSLRVRYRVNILGLDKKINTHSAQKINKSALPVTLEQVL